MTETRSLHRKLAEVMAEVERIPKRGRAPAQMGGFEFVQVGDAADAIRKALATRNVSMLPSAMEPVGESEHETRSGGTMTTYSVRVTWTLTDGDTGESATIQSLGTGADTGDKFTPKAQTNAMKYALLMGFLLSTGDDPELADTSDLGNRTDAAGEEQLELLGRLSKAGTVRKGQGRLSSLEARETPDGYVFGFRLQLPDKDIPQVVAEGEFGRALYLACEGDPEKALLGKHVTVKGRLFNVRATGRRSYYRLVMTDIETPDFKLPAGLPPAEPDTEPKPNEGGATLFDPADEAALAKAGV